MKCVVISHCCILQLLNIRKQIGKEAIKKNTCINMGNTFPIKALMRGTATRKCSFARKDRCTLKNKLDPSQLYHSYITGADGHFPLTQSFLWIREGKKTCVASIVQSRDTQRQQQFSSPKENVRPETEMAINRHRWTNGVKYLTADEEPREDRALDWPPPDTLFKSQ